MRQLLTFWYMHGNIEEEPVQRNAILQTGISSQRLYTGRRPCLDEKHTLSSIENEVCVSKQFTGKHNDVRFAILQDLVG